MKGFFLSLFFLSFLLGQLLVAQQPSLIIDADTIELGQALQVKIDQGEFSDTPLASPGAWEIQHQASDKISLLNFTPGIHRLPQFSYKTAEGSTGQLTTDELIVVSFPASAEASESPRPIASPVTIPVTWLDWAPQLAAIMGVFCWALIWLLATVKSYGPPQKTVPPITTKALAIQQLRRGIDFSPSTSLSHYQQVFRSYLAGLGWENARTIVPSQLSELENDSIQEKESFREIISMIEKLDPLRFSGEAVSKEDATHFSGLVTTFVHGQADGLPEPSPHYLATYGRPAAAATRMLAGLYDLLPIWLTLTGLLLWPGFGESLDIPMLFTTPGPAGLASIAGAFFLRTITAWLTIAGRWQATPGMRLLNIAVVGQRDNAAMRPLLWLGASIPLWLGHLGIFKKSRRSVIDSLLSQQVRRYPSQPATA